MGDRHLRPEQLLKAIGDLNQSIVGVMKSVDELRSDMNEKMAESERQRDEAARGMTARIGQVGNQVTFFRDNVCACLLGAKDDVLKSINERSDNIKESVKRNTKAQVSIFRDFFLKANPATKDEGRAVIASVPAKSVGVGPDEVAEEGKQEEPEAAATGPPPPRSNIPPGWAFDKEEEVAEEVAKDIVKSKIEAKLPFADDFDVHSVMKLAGADEVLRALLDSNKPKGMRRSTETPAYVQYLIRSLFTDFYVEDHAIPDAEVDEKTSLALPYVPKVLLSVLQVTAVNASYHNNYFDMDTFWKLVRNYFPDVYTMEKSSSKPTATSLLQQGQAAATEEDLIYKINRAKAKDADMLIRMMADYRTSSSGEDTPVEPVDPEKSKIEPKGEDEPGGEDTTQVRGTSVHGKKSTETYEKDGGRVTRKRAMEEVSSSNVDVIKKGKKN